MSTATPTTTAGFDHPEEQRFVLRAVDWPAYQQISAALTGRHVRLTYDGHNLEFMTISPLHANCSRLIGRFVVVLTEETNLPLRSFGDMTCDREDVRKGLEADECFYIANEPLIREKEQLDLSVDPPPDLAVEVEITQSANDRMDIYALLGVPEVWRFDGQHLTVSQRQEEGTYALASHSKYFGPIPIAELAAFVQRRTEVDENSLIREFREWVRSIA